MKWIICSSVGGVMLIVFCFVPTAYVATYLRGTYYPPGRLFVTSNLFLFVLRVWWDTPLEWVLREAVSMKGLHHQRN
jgi:hypothetical protein